MEIPLDGLIFEEFHKNESFFTLFGFLNISSFCNPAGGGVILHPLFTNKFSRIIDLELLLSNEKS